MGVSVTLVSKNETLAEFCRAILSDLFGTEWTLLAGSDGHVDANDDLCIWDFTPGETTVPHALEPSTSRRHWFLLYPKDVAELQADTGTTDLNMLFKPVSRTGMRALLNEASPHGNTRSDGNELAERRRGERGDMLRFLIQANLKLQEGDQQRNNFLARSVHDFRAPLTAISGYCVLLLEEELGTLTLEQRKVLERMLQSTSRLTRVSNDMFQLSVPANVNQKLNLEKADIRDCLDQALHEVGLVLEDKRISISADLEPAPEGLLFEKSQMEQTFVNLLDNASKFTPRDGLIEIRGYPFFWDRRIGLAAAIDPGFERRARRATDFNSYRLDMRDSGPGVPATHLDRIFEEYTSYGGGLDRSGGGLGLAICRMILHRHQGRIWAESDSSGTVFSFVLPLQESDAGATDVENSAELADMGTVEN